MFSVKLPFQNCRGSRSLINGTYLVCVSVICSFSFQLNVFLIQNWLQNIYSVNILLRLSSTFVIKLEYHGGTGVSRKETGTKDSALTGNTLRTCDSKH